MKNHICAELEKTVLSSCIDGVNLIGYDIESIDEKNFYLTKSYHADRQTVLDGEAELPGEKISSFTMKINYCPFCGKKL